MPPGLLVLSHLGSWSASWTLLPLSNCMRFLLNPLKILFLGTTLEFLLLLPNDVCSKHVLLRDEADLRDEGLLTELGLI